MKALVYERYGDPESVLELRDIDRPKPGPDEVLIRVRASSVGPWDWLTVNGRPLLFRPVTGFPSPKRTIPGADVAGQVEAIGDGVTRFQRGDAVYGESSYGGGYAEYVCVPESQLGHKPADLSFEQAASMPIAAMTALKGLRDVGQLKSGQHVLINGASGGIGTFAIQIAKAIGAEVTAVGSTRNLELMLSLGADYVIDYTREDFTESEVRYDVIFDVVGNHSPLRVRRSLKPKGRYVASFGRPDRKWVGPLLQLFGVMLLAPFGSRKMLTLLQTPDPDLLNTLNDLVESGAVTPVIDRQFELRDAAEALQRQGKGHAQGKTVVIVA